jgi:hypothetical protein
MEQNENTNPSWNKDDRRTDGDQDHWSQPPKGC